MYILIVDYVQVPEIVLPRIDGHRAWVKSHIASGDFIAAGPKAQKLGGAIIANAMPREAIEAIVASDPYVQNKLVEYRIVDICFNAVADGWEKLLAQ